MTDEEREPARKLINQEIGKEILKLAKEAGFDFSFDMKDLIMPGHPMGKIKVSSFKSPMALRKFLDVAVLARKAKGK